MRSFIDENSLYHDTINKRLDNLEKLNQSEIMTNMNSFPERPLNARPTQPVDNKALINDKTTMAEAYKLVWELKLNKLRDILICDEVMFSNVSHVSCGTSHTSKSISFGCIVKSENNSSSSGYNGLDGNSANEFSFWSRMYSSIRLKLPK